MERGIISISKTEKHTSEACFLTINISKIDLPYPESSDPEMVIKCYPNICMAICLLYICNTYNTIYLNHI